MQKFNNLENRTKSCSQKITLENYIFSRAVQLQVPVHARAGKLVSNSQDVCLQRLLELYNAFFYQENWEELCSQESPLEGWHCFQYFPERTPVFLDTDYKFELILGGKSA